MLCLKAEALGTDQDLYPPLNNAIVLPMDFGNTLQRYLRKGKDSVRVLQSRLSNRSSSASSSISVDGSGGSNSGLEETKTHGGDIDGEKDAKVLVHRTELEQDIKELQKQLEQEIDLHLSLASAAEHPVAPLSSSPCKLPEKVQELLANIAVLEVTVTKLEEELVTLQFQLSQERNERRLAEYNLRRMSISSSPRLAYSPASSKELITRSCNGDNQETQFGCMLQNSVGMEGWTQGVLMENLWHHPNYLSEEMVRCMRNIFLSLADSSKFPSTGYVASPPGHLSLSSLVSFSDSSIMPALKKSPSIDSQNDFEVLAKESLFDPYKAHGNVTWTKYIGSYSKAAEVSWMSVGEKQLEYAAEALKRFRLLVEQLAKVNPARMSCKERLAFWINLYNALIMHAYLAYGVPRSEVKLFSLMQKVAYTVGGYSFSAVDIEYIILKMKPPAYRPQIALVLALHKFKIPEEQRKYSIDSPEPLLAFALSSGVYSSPAVRIFRPQNVIEELQNSLKDYIRASVGISSKGKLVVPKLLHCFAKGIVEDSMLPDWICQFLSPEQAAMVRESSSPRKQRLLSPRTFTVLPFDSSFRYLFLSESRSSSQSSI